MPATPLRPCIASLVCRPRLASACPHYHIKQYFFDSSSCGCGCGKCKIVDMGGESRVATAARVTCEMCASRHAIMCWHNPVPVTKQGGQLSAKATHILSKGPATESLPRFDLLAVGLLRFCPATPVVEMHCMLLAHAGAGEPHTHTAFLPAVALQQAE